MNTYDHKKVVKLAFECFPLWQENIWKKYERNVNETCMFPDKYAIAMFEERTGSWRKYFPPVKSTHTFFSQQQRSFRECLLHLRFYIHKVIVHIKQKKMREAARFAGVFSHYIADFSHPAHYYELDIPKLLPPPRRMKNCNLHPLIENIQSSLEHISYKATLLGISEEEFKFNLETRFAKLHKKTLSSIVPMVIFIYQRKNKKAQKVFDRIMDEVARIFADFCYTSYAIALGCFPKREISRIDKCDLREVEPHLYDVEYNYCYQPLIDVITTDRYGHAKPFRLLKRKGNRKITTIVRGICAIPHALPLKGTTPSSTLEYHLPKKTYNRFKTTIGLYADIEKQPKCYFEIIGDGKSLYKSRILSPKDIAQSINVNITGCKKLKLVVHTDGSTDKIAYPIWGEPILMKKDKNE